MIFLAHAAGQRQEPASDPGPQTADRMPLPLRPVGLCDAQRCAYSFTRLLEDDGRATSSTALSPRPLACHRRPLVRRLTRDNEGAAVSYAGSPCALRILYCPHCWDGVTAQHTGTVRVTPVYKCLATDAECFCPDS